MLMLSITYRLAVGVGAAMISPLLLHEERLGVSGVLTRGWFPHGWSAVGPNDSVNQLGVRRGR